MKLAELLCESLFDTLFVCYLADDDYGDSIDHAFFFTVLYEAQEAFDALEAAYQGTDSGPALVTINEKASFVFIADWKILEAIDDEMHFIAYGPTLKSATAAARKAVERMCPGEVEEQMSRLNYLEVDVSGDLEEHVKYVRSL